MSDTIKTALGTYVHSSMGSQFSGIIPSVKKASKPRKASKKRVTVNAVATVMGATVKVTSIKSKGFYNYEVIEGEYTGKTGWCSTKDIFVK